MFKCVFFLFALLLFKPCYALTISADTPGSIAGNRSISLAGSLGNSANSTIVITLHTFDANDNSGWDIDSSSTYACQYPIADSNISMGDSEFQNYGSCKIRTRNYTGHEVRGTIFYTIRNEQLTEKTVYIDVAAWRTGKLRFNYRYTLQVPAKSTCNASIDNFDFGSRVAGQGLTATYFDTYVRGTANSKSLVISGTDIGSDGKLNLGGSSSGIKVYPSSSYISGSTWIPVLDRIYLYIDVSAARPGTWSSTALATLTCS